MQSSCDGLPRRLLAAVLLVVSSAHAIGAEPAVVEEPVTSSSQSEARMLAPVTLIQTLDGIPMHRIHVETRVHATVAIEIDGVVNEPDWATVLPHDNMLVAVPATGKPGRYPTDIRLLGTEEGLYVSAILYQPPDTLVTRR